MATLRSVIVPAKALKGGRHKVRISLSHNGEFRYIVTDIVIESEKEFKNGQIVKRADAALLNTKLRGLMQKYQNAIDSLEYTEGLTCAELVFQIKNLDKMKNRTLESVYNELMDCADLKPSTKKCYRACYNAITKVINGKSLVNNISHSNILALDKYMRTERKIKPCSIRIYMILFSAIINYAKRCGYVQYKVDPFSAYQMPRAEIRQSWLTVDQVRAIRDYDPPRKKGRLAKDLFMLSYYLGGINMNDLMDINFSDMSRIKYCRKKTDRLQKINKYVEFEIPQEAKEIISRLIGKDGRLALSETAKTWRCDGLFRHQLPKIAAELGIDDLIFYSARKSFAQHAFSLGIPEATIDYILGHKVDKGGSSLYNYIKVTPEIATKAVRLVLDNLK